MKYIPPGQKGSIVSVQPRYENFIGGKWLPPTMGGYRVNRGGGQRFITRSDACTGSHHAAR